MQRQGSHTRPNFQPYNHKMKGSQPNKFSSRLGYSKRPSGCRHGSPTTSACPIFSGPSGSSLNAAPRIPCQICSRTNHQALDCFRKMDYSFQVRHPPTQLHAMVAQANNELKE